MKKLILCALSLVLSHGAYSQAGSLIINNSVNRCDVEVQMFASCPSVAGTGCDNMISHFITVRAGATLNYTSPLNFESVVGWAPFGMTLGSSVPSDFQWTVVHFDYNNCFWGSYNIAGYIGDAGISCNGVGASYYLASPPASTPGGEQESWTPVSGSALSNVTITGY
jgi:hypothetical protein